MGAGWFSIGSVFSAKDKVSPVFNSMVKGAGRFENRLTRLTKHSQGFGTCIQGSLVKLNRLMNGFIGFFALSKLKQYADSTTQAAETELAAQAKLTQILKNNSSIKARGAKEYLKVSKDLFDLASNIQQKGVIGDEVLVGGMQALGSMGFDDRVIKKMLPVIADLAVQQKGYNVTIQDTENLAKGLGRALAGNTGYLSRMGVVLDTNQKKAVLNMSSMQRAEFLYELLSKRVGGLNEQLAKTDRGVKIQFLNNLSDRIEDIGKRIIPIESRFYSFFNKQMPVIIKSIDKFFNSLDYAFKALKPAVKKFGELVEYLAQSIFPALSSHSTDIKFLFEGVFVPGLVLAIDAIIKTCSVVENLYNGFKNIFSFVQDNFIPLFLTFSTILGGILLYNINQVAWGLLGLFVRFQALAGAIAWNTVCVWADVSALLAQAAAFAISPIGLITIAVVGLIAAVTLLWKNWDKVTETTVKWWNLAKTALGQFCEFAKGIFDNIAFFIKENFINVLLLALGPIGWVIKGIQNIGQSIYALANTNIQNKKIDLPDYRGGINNNNNANNNAVFVKNYPQASSGMINIRTTIDNNTPYQAKTSTKITEQNNLTLIPT